MKTPKRKNRRTKRGKKTRYKGITQDKGIYIVRARYKCPQTKTEKERERQLPLGTTLEEAKHAQLVLRDELKNEMAAERNRMTVGDYAHWWISEARDTKGVRLDTTLKGRAQALADHILPMLGDIPFDQLSAFDIKKWRTAMKERKRTTFRKSKKVAVSYSTATINNWWRILRAMCRDAVSDLELPRDPTLRIKALSEEPKKKDLLTKEEMLKFLAVAEKMYPQHYPLIVFFLATGLRFGEASAVHWSDIDFESRTVTINRRQVRQVIGAPKANKTRVVALDPFVVDMLKSHRRTMMAKQPAGWDKGIVFPNTKGEFFYPSLLVKPYKRIMSEIGVDKHITNHSMRRTYNNMMREAGVDRFTLQAMMGHCSNEMTDHYSEVSDDERRRAVEKGLSAIFEEVKKQTGDSTGDEVNPLEKKKKVGGQ